jgi:hypothetical protein
MRLVAASVENKNTQQIHLLELGKQLRATRRRRDGHFAAERGVLWLTRIAGTLQRQPLCQDVGNRLFVRVALLAIHEPAVWQSASDNPLEVLAILP